MKYTVIVCDHPGDMLVYRDVPEGPAVDAARNSPHAIVIAQPTRSTP